MIKEKGERGKQKTSKCQINTIKCQNILAKRSGLEEELKGNKEIKNRPNATVVGRIKAGREIRKEPI